MTFLLRRNPYSNEATRRQRKESEINRTGLLNCMCSLGAFYSSSEHIGTPCWNGYKGNWSVAVCTLKYALFFVCVQCDNKGWQRLINGCTSAHVPSVVEVAVWQLWHYNFSDSLFESYNRHLSKLRQTNCRANTEPRDICFFLQLVCLGIFWCSKRCRYWGSQMVSSGYTPYRDSAEQ